MIYKIIASKMLKKGAERNTDGNMIFGLFVFIDIPNGSIFKLSTKI